MWECNIVINAFFGEKEERERVQYWSQWRVVATPSFSYHQIFYIFIFLIFTQPPPLTKPSRRQFPRLFYFPNPPLPLSPPHSENVDGRSTSVTRTSSPFFHPISSFFLLFHSSLNYLLTHLSSRSTFFGQFNIIEIIRLSDYLIVKVSTNQVAVWFFTHSISTPIFSSRPYLLGNKIVGSECTRYANTHSKPQNHVC